MQLPSADLEDVEDVAADSTHLFVIEPLQHFHPTLLLNLWPLQTSFMVQMIFK